MTQIYQVGFQYVLFSCIPRCLNAYVHLLIYSVSKSQAFWDFEIPSEYVTKIRLL